MNTENIKPFLILSSKYVTAGLITAICAYYIPLLYKNSLRKPTLREIILLGLTASLTMFVLDMFYKPTSAAASLRNILLTGNTN